MSQYQQLQLFSTNLRLLTKIHHLPLNFDIIALVRKVQSVLIIKLQSSYF
jgi:hypothetical protein